MTKTDCLYWKYKQKEEMWKTRLQPYRIALIVILQHVNICSKTYQSVLANDPRVWTDYSSVAMHTRDTADEAIFSFNIKQPSVKKLF